MKKHVCKEEMLYDGSQLHHAFAYEISKDLAGDSIVSFVGPCEVKDHLVDLEDSLSNDFISSESMLHFIVEIFDINMTEAVLWQRTLINVIIEKLREQIHSSLRIVRFGDDIMLDDLRSSLPYSRYKLSVSIATLSKFSGLIHVGINIVPGDNCPVKAIGLKGPLSIGLLLSEFTSKDINAFQKAVLESFVNEFEDIKKATYKVIGV